MLTASSVEQEAVGALALSDVLVRLLQLAEGVGAARRALGVHGATVLSWPHLAENCRSKFDCCRMRGGETHSLQTPSIHFSLGRQVVSGSRMVSVGAVRHRRGVATLYHTATLIITLLLLHYLHLRGCSSVALPIGAKMGFLRAVLSTNRHGTPYWSQPLRACCSICIGCCWQATPFDHAPSVQTHVFWTHWAHCCC